VHTWGFGLGTEGPLSIVDINTRGTAGCAEGMRGTDGRTFPECKVSGASLFGLTGPPNGAGPQTEENKGAWSFCIVKLDGDISLPPEGTEAVCKVRLAARFPDVEGETAPARVYFARRVADQGVTPHVYLGRGGAILETKGNPPLVVEACEFLLKASSVAPFIRCDANDDGAVSIADAVWILNELFLGGARTRCAPRPIATGTGSGAFQTPSMASCISFRARRRRRLRIPAATAWTCPWRNAPPARRAARRMAGARGRRAQRMEARSHTFGASLLV
jgi:hypothetical protein